MVLLALALILAAVAQLVVVASLSFALGLMLIHLVRVFQCLVVQLPAA